MTAVNDLECARNIISKGIKYLNTIEGKQAWKFGGEPPATKKRRKSDSERKELWFFDKQEYEEASAIRELVRTYLEDPTPNRPLSLAVFGPPGCGKSFSVRQIQEEMKDHFSEELDLSFKEINLTQIVSSSELLLILKDTYKACKIASDHTGRETIPIIFFDEFDNKHSGSALGWLYWFLSPMQDSVIGYGDSEIKLSRAIFVFAGGTAHTFANFASNPFKEFVDSKGPDFVSRLRGYLNVRGPNDENRTYSRRALVIRSALDKQNAKIKLSEDLMERLFNEGRFIHGARSLSVLIEMAHSRALERPDAKEILFKDLPEDHILSIHVDQGPLDSETIGGLIGLSVGKDDENKENSEPALLVKDLSRDLWSYGATIGYGGKLSKSLATEILAESKKLSRKTATDQFRVELFGREDDTSEEDETTSSTGKKSAKKIAKKISLSDEVLMVPVRAYINGSKATPETRIAMSVFRMRYHMSCRSIARIIIAGKIDKFSGRMPGVCEEAMLSLAMGKPIYVIGGFGGAAKLIGELLGLAHSSEFDPGSKSWSTGFPEMSEKLVKSIKKNRSYFQPLDDIALPLTSEETVNFIASRAYGGPHWPDNGLSLSENRKLYSETDRMEICRIIRRGLSRKFLF